MATAWFGPCPHCGGRLSYLEGVAGSNMKPKCPRCSQEIVVRVPTFLMADNSRPRSPASVLKPLG